MAARCRIAVTRDDTGRIVQIDTLEADGKRRGLIEAAARGIAAGRTVTDAMLNAMAFGDLLRELVRIEQGKPPFGSVVPK